MRLQGLTRGIEFHEHILGGVLHNCVKVILIQIHYKAGSFLDTTTSTCVYMYIQKCGESITSCI